MTQTKGIDINDCPPCNECGRRIGWDHHRRGCSRPLTGHRGPTDMPAVVAECGCKIIGKRGDGSPLPECGVMNYRYYGGVCKADAPPVVVAECWTCMPGCSCPSGPECVDARCSYGQHDDVPDHRWSHYDGIVPCALAAGPPRPMPLYCVGGWVSDATGSAPDCRALGHDVRPVGSGS